MKIVLIYCFVEWFVGFCDVFECKYGGDDDLISFELCEVWCVVFD